MALFLTRHERAFDRARCLSGARRLRFPAAFREGGGRLDGGYPRHPSYAALRSRRGVFHAHAAGACRAPFLPMVLRGGIPPRLSGGTGNRREFGPDASQHDGSGLGGVGGGWRKRRPAVCEPPARRVASARRRTVLGCYGSISVAISLEHRTAIAAG